MTRHSRFLIPSSCNFIQSTSTCSEAFSLSFSCSHTHKPYCRNIHVCIFFVSLALSLSTFLSLSLSLSLFLDFAPFLPHLTFSFSLSPFIIHTHTHMCTLILSLATTLFFPSLTYPLCHSLAHTLSVFATAGSDGTVRIWSALTRRSHACVCVCGLCVCVWPVCVCVCACVCVCV